MVYALHSRLTFSGILGTVAAPFEIWSIRLNLGPITTGPIDAPTLQAAKDAWQTHLAPLSGGATRLREVKHARIGADGLYTEEPDILETDGGGTATGSLLYPPQIALCVSLDTATRGASGRGRFYVPNPTYNVGATGRLSTANQTTAVNGAAAFLGAINAIGNFGPVVIASTKGFNSVVTRCRVGDVLDTIRSRRNAIQESYTADVAVSQVAG